MLYWGCIKEDSLIQMADGSERPISQIILGDMVAVGNGGRVYGLELEDEDEAYFAGGIAVGTNTQQGKMFSIPQYKESAKCPAFRTELMEMKSFAENGGMTNGKSITHRY